MKYKRLKILAAIGGAALLAMSVSGCKQEAAAEPEVTTSEITLEIETEPIQYPAETMMELSPNGPLLPSLEGIEAEYIEPAPEYLRLGVRHPIVAELQERLMNLGFMDNDEPTEYYGEMTQQAIKTYQRQNELAQDGIVGPTTLMSIMSSDAKYYAAKVGDTGDDIMRIQTRLYELGYLPTADMVTGNFGEKTEEAVKKMQSVNSLTEDGKVGQRTINLIYSDEVKANMLAYGEESEVVLASQKRLKTLGYMTSEPDGKYGNDTIIAVKQFQSRNDQIVDGYLGPSTRYMLNSSEAVPNGLALGDEGDSVQRVQQMLSKLGYMSTANSTGYFGEVTERAVKQFQTTNGLSADGSVGIQTMAKLTSNDARRAPANSGSSSSSSSSGSGGSSSSGSGSTSKPNTSTAPAGSSASALISIASSKVGSPYVYGAKGPSSFDCSGFVYWCLNQAGVRQSYLTSSGWRNVGKYTKITSYSNLQAGDIIVVNGHVGIVAGGGTVIDASSSNGRVVHRSLSSWWANNFICGWRIF